MDYMGILKDAWGVTRHNRSLWVLGLFATGAASVTTSNWSSSNNDFKGFEGWQNSATTHVAPMTEIQTALDKVGTELGVSLGPASNWIFAAIIAVLVLMLVCLVFWAIGVAARGGLIEQTREALAGRATSARAGWRTGFRYWGRVFLVGFLLSLPLIAVGAVGGIAFLAMGGLTAMAGDVQVTAGLIAMGTVLALLGLLGIGISVVTTMLHETALRHAILDDIGALDSIKATWAELRARRGVASMWLVMIVVNICASIAGGIVFVPALLIAGLIIAGAVAAGGTSMFWLLLPFGLILFAMGLAFKALYTTFVSAAWTAFFTRIERPELAAA